MIYHMTLPTSFLFFFFFYDLSDILDILDTRTNEVCYKIACVLPFLEENEPLCINLILNVSLLSVDYLSFLIMAFLNSISDSARAIQLI